MFDVLLILVNLYFQHYIYVKAKKSTEWATKNILFLSIFAHSDSKDLAHLSESSVFNIQAACWLAKTSTAKKNFISVKHCHFPPLDELFWHELLMLCCSDAHIAQHEQQSYTVFEYGIQHGGLLLATLRNAGTYLGFETSSRMRKQIATKITARAKGDDCMHFLVLIIL
jgi:hypothetical protein